MGNGRTLHTRDREDEVDYAGAWSLTLAGRVPERGEIIVHPEGVEWK